MVIRSITCLIGYNYSEDRLDPETETVITITNLT